MYNMATYHYNDALITFILMTLAMISGALIFFSKKYSRYFIIAHTILAIATYIMMIYMIIRAPRF